MDKLKPKKPKYGHKSQDSSYNGVYTFIQKHYPEVFKGTFEHPEKRPAKTVVNSLMQEFLREICEVEHKKGNSHAEVKSNAIKVQARWKDFVSFLEPEFDY